MNRQSGSQAPIPVTPKDASPSQQPLLQFSGFPASTPKSKRRSREARSSWLFPARQKVAQAAPIWRPSTGSHSPPTPQWPLPRQPLDLDSHRKSINPFFSATYTQPREAPIPVAVARPPSSRCSNRDSAGSSTTTLSEERAESPAPPPKDRSMASPPAAERVVSQPVSPRTAAPPPPPRSPQRPPPTPFYPTHQRNGSFSTRYINMVLSVERIPRSHNILSNVFSWMMLVAFVLAPANFCSPPAAAWGDDSSGSSSGSGSGSAQPEPLVNFYHDVPSKALLGACFGLFGLGALGVLYLALCWRHNYIWLLNRIYLPLILNSTAGLIACLVSLRVQHGMWWSLSSYVTIGFEGGFLLVSIAMFAVINYLLLGKLKREHFREASRKNWVDLVKAGKEPPFAPGSVV